MQSALTDIIDYVWELADLAIQYGQISDDSDIERQERIVELCGLRCVFINEDIAKLEADNLELHLMWRSFKGANDNILTQNMLVSEIFPESATFLKGDIEALKKWHADLTPLHGSLVA